MTKSFSRYALGQYKASHDLRTTETPAKSGWLLQPAFYPWRKQTRHSSMMFLATIASPFFFKIRLNIILPYMSSSSKRSPNYLTVEDGADRL